MKDKIDSILEEYVFNEYDRIQATNKLFDLLVVVEPLKNKKIITFKEYATWLGYNRVCKGAFLKDNIITYRKELNKKYKNHLKTL